MRRPILKWLHWLCLPLITYFWLVEPEENRADPSAALSTHAGVGMVLGVIVVIWFCIYLVKGVTGRAGPKLPGWAKRVHPIMHKALYIGLPVMLVSGGLTGLLAPFAVNGFGMVPISLEIGSKGVYEFLQDVHELVFNGLITIIVVHTVFHLWRHFILKDNALRIMVPKVLHKYLK